VLVTKRNSPTPEILNTIYEQISRRTVVPNNLVWPKTQPGSRHHEPVQLITDLCRDPGYSHLEAELENRHRKLEQVLVQKKEQERAAHNESVKRRNTGFAYSRFTLNLSTLRTLCAVIYTLHVSARRSYKPIYLLPHKNATVSRSSFLLQKPAAKKLRRPR
jgi:hypothetical protein